MFVYFLLYSLAVLYTVYDVNVTTVLNTSDQIMFNVDKAPIILDEMITNGQITETNKNRVLVPVAGLDRVSK